MAKLKGTSAQFQIAVQATLDATHRALVDTAKREHAKVLASDPRPGGFNRWVDGQKGAREEAVKPYGVIEYQYSHLDLVAQFAMETLFDLSPVLSGDYRNSHTLFLGGDAVANLKGWKPGDTVYVASFLPYSRVIENGSMKMRVPGTDQVYAQASWIVHRRYGNLANIGWTYIGVVDGRTGMNGVYDKSDARYPALLIQER